MAQNVSKQIDDLMKQLGSTSYKAPDISKSMDFSYKQAKFKPIDVGQWNYKQNDFGSTKSAGKGKGKGKDKTAHDLWGFLGGLANGAGHILDDTLGQVGGVTRDMLDNVVGEVKNNKNAGDWVNDFSNLIGNVTGHNIAQGAFQYGKTLADGKWNNHDIPFYDAFNQDNIDKMNGFNAGKTILQNLRNGGMAQGKTWHDGKTTKEDFGIGFLDGMAKGHVKGKELNDHVFGKMQEGWKKELAGVATEIITDPLSYATFGVGAAARAGKAAELGKITDIQKVFGIGKGVKKLPDLEKALKEAITGKAMVGTQKAQAERIAAIAKDMKIPHPVNNMDDLLAGAKNVLTKKYPNSHNTIDKHLLKIQDDIANVGKMHLKSVDAQVAKIMEELKAAKVAAYNANVNKMGVSIPFTNKQLLTDLPKMSPVYKTEGKLGSEFAHVAENLIHDVAKGDTAKTNKVLDAALAKYGANSVKDLTKSQVKELNKILRNPDTNFTTKMKELKKPTLEMSGGRTKMEHALDKHNPFNARTLRTKDAYLNSMGDEVANALTRQYGETAKYAGDLNKIEKFIRGNKLTPDQMKEAAYVIEGKAPDHYPVNWTPSSQVQELAGHIQSLLKKVGNDNTAEGMMNTLKEGILPKTITAPSHDVQELLKFAQNDTVYPIHSLDDLSTQADIENYLQHLHSEHTAAPDVHAKHLIQDQIDRVMNLHDANTGTALLKTVRTQVKQRAVHALKTDLKQYGMYVSNPKHASDLKGLELVNPDDVKKLGLGEGQHYMHPEVLKGMKQLNKAFSSKGVEKYSKHMSALVDIWRPLVTYYNPSYHVNNMVGNSIMNLVAGVNVKNYAQAGKLLLAKATGKVSPEQQKILDAAYKYNVIGGNFLAHDAVNDVGKFTDPIGKLLNKTSNLANDNKLVNGMKNASSVVDDFSRLANFMHGLEQTGSSTKAADQVRKYLFNYSEMTNKDRTMRIAFPFWNWMKNNAPTQWQLLMEQPRFKLNSIRFQEAFNNNQDGKDWQKQEGIKIPGTNRYYTKIANPVNDLTATLNPIGYGMNSLNPVIKIPLELMTNHQFFNNRPITSGSFNVQTGKGLHDYLRDQTGIIGKGFKSHAEDKNILEVLSRIFAPTTEVKGGNSK